VSKCFISPLASRDLNAIADYYVTRNIEAGEELLKNFTQKCDLVPFPNLGRSYDYVRTGIHGTPLARNFQVIVAAVEDRR
jgi:toxin ParE1/3/4